MQYNYVIKNLGFSSMSYIYVIKVFIALGWDAISTRSSRDVHEKVLHRIQDNTVRVHQWTSQSTKTLVTTTRLTSVRKHNNHISQAS